jgi:hypothetical protein
MPANGIATDEDGFGLEFYLDNRAGEEWVLWHDPRITLAVADAVRHSPWGMPTVAPEVLLFFKARDLRRRDRLDFAALLPGLDPERRAWLREALALVGHPWLAALDVDPVERRDGAPGTVGDAAV